MKVLIASLFCLVSVSSLPQQPFGVDIGTGRPTIPGLSNSLANSPLGLPQNGLSQNGLSQNGLSQNGLSQNSLGQNGLSQNGLAAIPNSPPAFGSIPQAPVLSKRNADSLEAFRQFSLPSTPGQFVFPGEAPVFTGFPSLVKRGAADLSGRIVGTGSPVPRAKRGLFGGDDLTTPNVLAPRVATIPTGHPNVKREILASTTVSPLASRQKRGLFGADPTVQPALPLAITLSSTTQAAKQR